MTVQIYPLRWEKCGYDVEKNTTNVKITAVDKDGKILEFVKKYNDWLGVCTSDINKVASEIIQYFPTCKVKFVKLSENPFKKVLPYFKDRLARGKLSYSSKPFYKVYTSAPIEDVGNIIDKKKISYYSKEDWLTRIYIDICNKYNCSEFYYKWYKVDSKTSFLLDSFEMLPDCNLKPNINIASFDLETVPLDKENRVPTGHDRMDQIVMISIVKWNLIMDKTEKIVLYLNPISESLNFNNPEFIEYFSEKDMLIAFHKFIKDVHVLTGYNINNFDLPCIFARLIWLNMRKILNEYTSKKIGNYIVPTYQNKIIIDMYNFIQIFSSYDLPSFKLDDVAKCKLGYNKVPIKAISIHCWYNDCKDIKLFKSINVSECFNALKPKHIKEYEFGTFLKCIEYCLHDSVLVYKLFNHEMALDFLIERSNFGALNIEHSLYQGNSKYIFEIFKTYGTRLGFFINTHYFKNTVEEDGHVLKSFMVGKNESTYQGALNFCTPGTFFKNVFVFDFTSMYPSILLNQNLCYGTCSILDIKEYLALPPEIHNQCTAVPYRTHSENDFLINNKFPFERYEHPVIDLNNDTAVMIWYKNEKGFLPQLIEHFLVKRKEYRKFKDVNHHNKQLNIKIFLNSIYGCMASSDTIFAQLHIAMIITAFARIYLLASAEYFSNRGYVVAYSDTDSIFVQDCKSADGQLVNDYLNQPHMSLAFERIMDYLLVISKKRYIYECNNKVCTKGFEKKSNELVKWMSQNIIVNCLNALKENCQTDASDGWILWIDTLVQAYIKCKNPKKYCITRKTKALSEYKSTTCPQLKLLQRYPENAGEYIDYTYSQADISLKESTKWIMKVEDCNHVNFEKLFVSQKKIFITLLNITYFKLARPEKECNKILNTMKWKNFLNAELKCFFKTKNNMMILIERGHKYTFEINDY